LICVVLGVGAGAVTTNPVYPASLYIFVVLLIAPVVMVNIQIGDQTHLILAGMLTVFMTYVLNAGRALSRTFESSLRMDFENAQLVGLLLEENQRAEAAQQQAEQASKTKSKFLAAASHDLRQPMHALALFVEVLKNRTHDAQSTQLIAQVEESVGVLEKMFEALLDVSKLDAGVVQPRLEAFAIQPMLDRMYAEFSWLAREKKLDFKVTCDCRVMVRSDPLLLERILRNLISNAICYTENGQVEIGCAQLSAGLQLEVRDTGIGIAPEHLPAIFEEYYQVGNQQRDRNKGLGLGLAIVKRLEKLLGYQLQVSSALGVGTSFFLLIPEHKPDDMIETCKAI
jgi:signal transduction histidine kinase